jgi:hypothetical protein
MRAESRAGHQQYGEKKEADDLAHGFGMFVEFLMQFLLFS